MALVAGSMPRPKYVVVELKQPAAVFSSFRLFDQNNYWTNPAIVDLTGKQKVVIDLHQMTNEKGVAVDPSHIYIAGFWTNGSGPLYIGDVFVSNDGSTPVTAVGQIALDPHSRVVTSEYYDLSGRRLGGLLPQGVTVVRQHLSDGSVRVVKQVR